MEIVHNVEIRNTGLRTEVFIDGEKIEGVTKLELEITPQKPPELKLSLMTDSIMFSSNNTTVADDR